MEPRGVHGGICGEIFEKLSLKIPGRILRRIAEDVPGGFPEVIYVGIP